MWEYFLYTYGNQILLVILCAIFGMLGRMLKGLAVRYLDEGTKLSVARIAVQYVEQVWTAIHGTDKLSKALETAEALLKKKGIPFDAEEMKIMIEAALAEFNEVFCKPLELPETADAVRRVDGFAKPDAGDEWPEHLE